jgi:hypothetical protein
MGSLTRSDLKDIVKECIIEVMLEGLRADSKPQLQKESTQRESTQRDQPLSMKKHLDSISFSAGAAKVADQAQGRRSTITAVSNLVSEFPKEQQGIMQQMFEDTARNTLPGQLTADRNPAAAQSQMNEVASSDPMKIFDGASNWADLAFAATKK